MIKREAFGLFLFLTLLLSFSLTGQEEESPQIGLELINIYQSGTKNIENNLFFYKYAKYT
jgi:hypothetical protein